MCRAPLPASSLCSGARATLQEGYSSRCPVWVDRPGSGIGAAERAVSLSSRARQRCSRSRYERGAGGGADGFESPALQRLTDASDRPLITPGGLADNCNEIRFEHKTGSKLFFMQAEGPHHAREEQPEHERDRRSLGQRRRERQHVRWRSPSGLRRCRRAATPCEGLRWGRRRGRPWRHAACLWGRLTRSKRGDRRPAGEPGGRLFPTRCRRGDGSLGTIEGDQHARRR